MQDRSKKAKICGYEIHNAGRFCSYTFVLGIISTTVVWAGSSTTTDPSQILVANLAGLSIFGLMTFMGLRAEDREAKAAYARANLFALPTHNSQAEIARPTYK